MRSGLFNAELYADLKNQLCAFVEEHFYDDFIQQSMVLYHPESYNSQAESILLYIDSVHQNAEKDLDLSAHSRQRILSIFLECLLHNLLLSFAAMRVHTQITRQFVIDEYLKIIARLQDHMDPVRFQERKQQFDAYMQLLHQGGFNEITQYAQQNLVTYILLDFYPSLPPSRCLACKQISQSIESRIEDRAYSM